MTYHPLDAVGVTVISGVVAAGIALPPEPDVLLWACLLGVPCALYRRYQAGEGTWVDFFWAGVSGVGAGAMAWGIGSNVPLPPQASIGLGAALGFIGPPTQDFVMQMWRRKP